jgi:hypothetical protein
MSKAMANGTTGAAAAGVAEVDRERRPPGQEEEGQDRVALVLVAEAVAVDKRRSSMVG